MLRTTLVITLSAMALVAPMAPASRARADHLPGDPLAYDLRLALFPASFQAGVTQSSFGAALRAEYRVLRRLDLGAYARVGYWNFGRETRKHRYQVGFGASIHLHESLSEQRLLGVVYPDNPPAIRGADAYGAPTDLEQTTSTKLGSVPFSSDADTKASALMYSVISLRLGAAYLGAALPAQLSDPENAAVYSRFPIAHLGVGWGEHWNIAPDVTGKLELGYRRFYVDALATLPSLVKEENLFSEPDLGHPDIFPIGARIGMEGAIDALLARAPGVGFAYSLELGALPMRDGVEGYLFVGLGLALDIATR